MKKKLSKAARKKDLTGVNLDPIHRRLEAIEEFIRNVVKASQNPQVKEIYQVVIEVPKKKSQPKKIKK